MNNYYYLKQTISNSLNTCSMLEDADVDLPYTQQQLAEFQHKWESIHEIIIKYKIKPIDQFTTLKGQLSRQQYSRAVNLIYELVYEQNGLFATLILRRFCNYIIHIISVLECHYPSGFSSLPKLKGINKLWKIFTQYYDHLSHLLMHLFDSSIDLPGHNGIASNPAQKRFILKIIIKNTSDLNSTFTTCLNEIRFKNHRLFDKQLDGEKIDMESEMEGVKGDLEQLKQYVVLVNAWGQIEDSDYLIKKLELQYIQNTNSFYYQMIRSILISKAHSSTTREPPQSIYLRHIQILLYLQIFISRQINLIQEEPFKLHFKNQFILYHYDSLDIHPKFNFKDCLQFKNVKLLKMIYEVYENFHCCQELIPEFKEYLHRQITRVIAKIPVSPSQSEKNMNTVSKWIALTDRAQILVNKLLLFHRSMKSLIDNSFDRSVLFISVYMDLFYEKLKPYLKLYRPDRVVMQFWDRDIRNPRLKEREVVSMVRTYLQFLKIIKVNEKVLYNSLSLALISRLERDQSEQHLNRELEVLGVMKNNGVIDENVLLMIWNFYFELRVGKGKKKRRDYEQIQDPLMRVSILKNQCFRGIVSEMTQINCPTLCRLKADFCSTHTYNNILFLYEINSVIWSYKLSSQCSISIKGNIVQYQLFLYLSSKQNMRMSVSQLQEFQGMLMIQQELLLGNLAIMIGKSLVRVVENSGEKDRVGGEYDTVLTLNMDSELLQKVECLELENYYNVKLLQYEQGGHTWKLEGSIVKVMKRNKEMSLERLVDIVLKQEKVFNTQDSVKEIVNKLAGKGFLRVEDEMVFYLP